MTTTGAPESGASQTYPPRDVEKAAALCAQGSAALGDAASCQATAGPVVEVVAVEPGSVAEEAGFAPGWKVTGLDGEPVSDIIDWQWRSAGDCIEVGYVDAEGNEGIAELERECGEPWGLEFDLLVFDGVKQCRNACSFCFMRQLPADMRESLYLRDDDYRLSFLAGTFVTLTNLSAADEARIVEQRLSPLRVSLHAVDPAVRKALMGAHAQAGLDAFERLLAAGIEAHVQIVLVPGVNDGEVLKSTLDWAYRREGILTVGIVPLGYTRHQEAFDSGLDRPWQAEEILRLIEPFQQRALAERGYGWVYAADELYLTAYGRQVLEKLPDASFYGEFDMFEDGIGIVRSVLDEWHDAEQSGLLEQVGSHLVHEGLQVALVSGFAPQAYLTILARDERLQGRLLPFYVENRYFGGNVDVTGLLTGQDVINALQALEGMQVASTAAKRIVALPRVMFNDDGLTLDGMALTDIAQSLSLPVAVVSCFPRECFQQLLELTGADL